jgi:hypothetical protein
MASGPRRSRTVRLPAPAGSTGGRGGGAGSGTLAWYGTVNSDCRLPWSHTAAPGGWVTPVIRAASIPSEPLSYSRW